MNRLIIELDGLMNGWIEGYRERERERARKIDELFRLDSFVDG
jgi:hypothetical protein